MSAAAPAPSAEKRGGILDKIEEIGNKVPNPILMFVYLAAGIIVLSAILALFNVSATETIAEPKPVTVQVDQYEDNSTVSYDGEAVEPDYEIHEVKVEIKSLLSVEGIRFIFSTFVSTVQGFSAIGVTLVAMAGAGAAEGVGLMNALIRKIVNSAPKSLITFLIIFVGGLSSLASDAGYLILIPLAAVAFLALGRHPIAGLAAGFAGVAATFLVNVIPTPTDAMLTEIANEAIVGAGGKEMSIVSNLYFSIASLFLLCFVATIITTRILEPRLGKFDRANLSEEAKAAEEVQVDGAAEAKGLRFAGIGVLALTVLIVAITAPPGAPLRDPVDGNIIGQTPFMSSLLFIIALYFLVAAIGFGIGSGSVKKPDDIVAAIIKTYSGLGGLFLMLVMIAQFVSYFNYSQIPKVISIGMADLLEKMGLSAIPLLLGFIIIMLLLDFIIPGALPAWAIFAPIFIPIFMRLDVAPQTLFAAYRIGDSPVNTLTPLMVYFPFIVTIAQRYMKDAGIGTIISIMVPYAAIMAIVWVIFFILWFIIGIPLGPGYPVSM
ncbi:MAG: AbgT family transporter [Thermomicrobiales bacterium]